MNDAALPYASYLLRLWIHPLLNQRAPAAGRAKSSTSRPAIARFSNPDALWAFLNQNHRSGERDAAPTVTTNPCQAAGGVRRDKSRSRLALGLFIALLLLGHRR